MFPAVHAKVECAARLVGGHGVRSEDGLPLETAKSGVTHGQRSSAVAKGDIQRATILHGFSS